MREEGRRMAAGTSAAQGMRVTKRAMAGRRVAAAPSTPVPSWRVFNNQLYDGVLAARGPAPPPASARRLAASLRELQLLDLPLPACLSACVRSPDWPPCPDHSQPATPPGRQSGHDFGVSAQTRDHLRKLLRKTASMESVERQRHVPSALFSGKKETVQGEMEEGSRTMSQELLKVFSQIRVLEEEHSSSLSLTTALHAELVAAHARVRELEAAGRREKAKEKERVRELEVERAARTRLEGANRRLARELVDAQAAAAGALQELESERRARRLMEEVCQELVQETAGGDKAEVEELKRESQKVREELEEERRMLQLAEVWREERVQMKLGEAKLALEEKSAALDVMKDELESFLRATHDGDDDSHVRDAQVLHEVIHAISAFPTSEYVPEASSSSSALRKPREDAPVYYAEGIPDAD